MTIHQNVLLSITNTLTTELENDPEGMTYKVDGVFRDIYDRDPANLGLMQIINKVPQIPNPVPQDQIPKPWSQKEFIGDPGDPPMLVSPEQLNAMIEHFGFGFVREVLTDIENNVRESFKDKLLLVIRLSEDLAHPIIDEPTKDALFARYADTYLDPSWSPTVKGKSRFMDLAEAHPSWIHYDTNLTITACQTQWLEAALLL